MLKVRQGSVCWGEKGKQQAYWSPGCDTMTGEHVRLPQQQCYISGACEDACVTETTAAQRSDAAIYISWLLGRLGKLEHFCRAYF